MKFTKNIIALAVLLALTNSVIAAELSGKISIENAMFQSNGQTIGSDEDNEGGDFFKNELNARFYLDGDIGDNVQYHSEVSLFHDTKTTNEQFANNESNTQRDLLREMYIDTSLGDYDFRIGKQQVVWGVGDGIKLLDLINPTDYSEFNQNLPADARLPVWMLNIETASDETDTDLQFIISQPRENVFAGLNRGIDTSVRTNENPTPAGIPDKIYAGHNQGHVFVLKGIDTITGAKNGFLNIAPDLGSVAAGFAAGFVPLFNQQRQANPQGLSGLNSVVPDGASAQQIGGANIYNAILTNFTVGKFTSGYTLAQLDGGFRKSQLYNGIAKDSDSDGIPDIGGTIGFADTYFGLNIASQACRDTNFNSGFGDPTQNGGAGNNTSCSTLFGQFDPQGSGQITGSQTIIAQQTAIIFNQVATGTQALTGVQVLNGFGDKYATNLASFGDGKRDSAFEYMTNASFRTFDTFTNARSQYLFDMPNIEDKNVNLAFRAGKSFDNGVNGSIIYSNNYDPNPVINLSWRNDKGEVLTKKVESIDSVAYNPTKNATYTSTGQYISLVDGQGNQYGGSYDRSAILTFEQTLERTTNVGLALDYALDIKNLNTFVLRLESLYQSSVFSPIIDLDALARGDLTEGLKMVPGRKVKYIFGAEFNIYTNMLVSTQYILESNINYVNDENKYTADLASMHLTNGLRRADRYKRYYSLFLTKPFGSSGQHRLSNIFIYDEIQKTNGVAGKWNRLQLEYAINDETTFNFESNGYWGDVNTQFGQLKDSASVQFGIDYRF